MANNKLYSHLIKFQNDDLQRFLLFVKSPFHNRNSACIAYMEVLADTHPHFANSDEDVFHVIWPGEPFQARRLRDLRSVLLKLLKQFIACIELESSPQIRKRLLLEGCDKRGLSNLAAKAFTTWWEGQAGQAIANFSTAEYDLMLHERRVVFSLQEDGEGVVDVDYGPLLLSLDRYYLARRFEILAAMNSYKEIIKREVPGKAGLESAFLAERSGALQEPLVKAYHQLLEFQAKSVTLIELKRYFAFISSDEVHLSPDKHFNILAALINKFLADLRLGVPDSLRKAFLTYQQLHQHNLYAYIKTGALKLIRSTVAAGARLGEFSWTRRYLEEAIDQVPPELRSMTYRFGMAQLAFHQRAFSEAKKHLLHVEFSDPQIRLSAQNILLKCYFEMQETEAFISLIESTRRYLQRHKEFSPNYRQGYQNFLNLIRPVYDLRWELGAKVSGRQLLEKLDAYEYFFNRDWIREQLDALADA